MPKSEIAASNSNPVFNFLGGLSYCFPWHLQHFTVSPTEHAVPVSPHPHRCSLLCLRGFLFVDDTILVGVKWYLIVVLIHIFLMITGVWASFHVLTAI